MHSFNQFVHLHKKAKDKQRLGQRFYNMFIKKGYGELFYCQDKEAEIIIKQYLTDNQYINNLPPIVL